MIDATGKFVFPGFIDPHVHIHLPFMGTFAKDNYETASRAAIVGGTTTLIEMCCPARRDDALASFEHWMAQAAGKSACDFTFHMGVARFDAATEAQLREIVAAASARSRSSSPTRARSGSTTRSSTARSSSPGSSASS